MVVSASTPMVMPEMVRKLRSLWRATLRMVSIGLFRLRCGRLKAGKGSPASRLRHQAGQISRGEPPAFLMERALLPVGGAAVSQSEQRAGSVGREGDLNSRRARRHLGVAFPAPRHDKPVRR